MTGLMSRARGRCTISSQNPLHYRQDEALSLAGWNYATVAEKEEDMVASGTRCQDVPSPYTVNSAPLFLQMVVYDMYAYDELWPCH